MFSRQHRHVTDGRTPDDSIHWTNKNSRNS